MSKSDRHTSKSKFKRVKALPWAVLLQVGTVLGKRWRSLSANDRARLTRLTRESRGRMNNLSAKERRELRKLVGKLDFKRMSRELLPITRNAHKRKRP
jgi:hypothetical protein